MALRTMVNSKLPLIVILGATGTGKTKLGVELAQKFNTEIISADSMQVYKGLDVVTAKATAAERASARHHLLDLLEPTHNFTVVDFRNRALKIIDELIEKDKIPIVVGGTNYYIESIVYQILVEDMDDSDALLWDVSRRKRDTVGHDDPDDSGAPEAKVMKETTEATTSKEVQKSESETLPGEPCKKSVQAFVDDEKTHTNEEIHAKLKEIDPDMAGRLHPNNRRKILRSIEVWLQSGRRHSAVLAAQRGSEGLLRRPGATLLLWLTCDRKVHEERLDKRIDSMLRQGLVPELADFHARYNLQRMQDGQPPDYTKGIFQTLGFKEFHEYLMLSQEERDSDGGRKLLEISIENMKIGTKRYARRQNKMIRGRFLEHPNREVPPIYELNTTDVEKWDSEVQNKAIKIIESFTIGSPCEYSPLKSVIDDEEKDIDRHSSNYCEVCERVLIGDKIYQIHMNSFKHKRALKRKRKLELQKDEDN